jgi:hypothetical protein
LRPPLSSFRHLALVTSRIEPPNKGSPPALRRARAPPARPPAEGAGAPRGLAHGTQVPILRPRRGTWRDRMTRSGGLQWRDD